MFRRGQTLSLRHRNVSLRRENLLEQEKYGELSIFKKMLTLNKNEWWIILLGVVAAMITGSAFPIFSVFLGGVFDVLSGPTTSDVLSLIHPWASGCIALGISIGAAMFVKVSQPSNVAYNSAFILDLIKLARGKFIASSDCSLASYS